LVRDESSESSGGDGLVLEVEITQENEQVQQKEQEQGAPKNK
jgi:hypothetical protein